MGTHPTATWDLTLRVRNDTSVDQLDHANPTFKRLIGRALPLDHHPPAPTLYGPRKPALSIPQYRSVQGGEVTDWEALHEYGKLTIMFGLDRWMRESAIESLYRDEEGWINARFRDGTEWGPVDRDDATTIGWIAMTIEAERS